MSKRLFYPDEKTFIGRAGAGNVIPVYTELLADLQTPVSSFMRIDHGEYSYLLESVEGGERLGRYSFLGSNPSLVVRAKGATVEIIEGRKTRKVSGVSNPLERIKDILKKYRFAKDEGLPRFCGGMVGYIGYDVVRSFEKIPDKNPDTIGVYDCVFVLTDTILIFDHLDHKIKVVANVIVPDGANKRVITARYRAATSRLEKIVADLKKPLRKETVTRRAKTELKIRSNITPQQFKKMIVKAKEYITRGDVIQVVLSQRFETTVTKAEGLALYRALRSVNPSPYMYYLSLGDVSLIGSSPEMLVRCEDGEVETRPIAGTRPRGADAAEDRSLANDLLADPKERAEHLMLVDLSRNDLGRVCQVGSVSLPRFMIVERYSHVMHIVTEVVGRLKEDRDAFDLIAAAFPAGTVSGAPKVRAMEIIDELEPTRRGPYAGCVGYLSFSGNLDTCITIRTIVKKGKKVYVQAGAGIVADSDPSREYDETVNKAKALFKAVQMAEEGLD